MAVKKAVVDFVLSDSLQRKQTSQSDSEKSAGRLDVASIALKYKHK